MCYLISKLKNTVPREQSNLVREDKYRYQKQCEEENSVLLVSFFKNIVLFLAEVLIQASISLQSFTIFLFRKMKNILMNKYQVSW